MKWVYGILAVVIVLGGVAFWAVRFGPLGFVQGYFLNPPPEPEGTVTLVEPEIGLKHFVYLPPSYESDAPRSFPVIYHLHGAMPFPWFLAQDAIRADVMALANRMEALAAEGAVEPAIIVAPYDGFGFSMWSDSSSGHVTVQSDIVERLLPEIAAAYRVTGTRETTFIQGFSMGGFGATKIALQYPELFSRMTSWDGAIHSWTTLNETRVSVAENMFASREDFDRQSPWTAAESYADEVPNLPMTMALFSGEMEAPSTYTAAFREHLTRLDVPFSFAEAKCPHDIFCFMTPERVRVAYGSGGG